MRPLPSLRFLVPLLPIAIAAVSASCGSAPPRPAQSAATAATTAPRLPRLTSAEIDERIRSEWQKRAIAPSAPASDAAYLRRVYLDIVGVVPPPARVRAFLADPAPDKRARVVRELLASPDYADYWTSVWDDILMGRTKAGEIDRAAFRVWLHGEFEKNVPWNEVALSLVTATGRQSAGKQRNLAETEAALADRPEISGAANYVLRFRQAPQDFAGSAAKTFLGTQIQCAQCHDHKTEKWTQAEFQRFAACFMRVRPEVQSKGPNGRIVELHDVDRPLAIYVNNPDLAPIAKATPTALDGTPMTGNVRQSVAQWMVANPNFARALVNRMWGHFLGRGFVNPVDDLRPSNAAELGDLLDRIAQEFARSGYDLKQLVALITGTEVYRLSATASDATASRAEIPLWSRFRVNPLGADELVNSLLAATGTDAALARRGGAAELADLKLKISRLFSFTFDVDEEFDQTRYEGTLAQALELMNGKLTGFGSSARPGTVVFQLARSELSDEARIEELFLRTVSRRPTPEESSRFAARLREGGDETEDTPSAAAEAPRGAGKKGGGKKVPPNPLQRLPGRPAATSPRVAALEDLEWALLNSSEFVLNH